MTGTRKADADKANILPAGDATAAAGAAVRAIKAKGGRLLRRCRLAAYDPRAVALLNRKGRGSIWRLPPAT